MMDWQEKLINELVLNERLCFIIHDPDFLCYEPKISKAIELANVTVFDDNDPVALRLVYENWLDSDNHTAFLVRYSHVDDLVIPYDLSKNSKLIDFHLSEVIQEIDSEVLRVVPSEQYQLIIDIVNSYRPGKLNKTTSLDFVLRHVYKIAPEVIQTDVDLVRLMIRKHYLTGEMPKLIEQRLIELLELNSTFDAWDFNLLIPKKSAFFEFLQQQWMLYLKSLIKDNKVNESWPKERLIVPFEDQDVCVFVDNLFADGLLKPVEFTGLELNHWAWIGIKTEDGQIGIKQYHHLYKIVSGIFANIDLEDKDANFWGLQAPQIGRLNILFYQYQPKLSKIEKEDLNNLNKKIDEFFETWLLDKYGSLISTPSVRHPNMLHKVPDWLNRKVLSGKKICLLVMDGMGFQQWALMRDKLTNDLNIDIDDHYCFAWVPSITSISRQSLFSGKKPYFFSDSLLTTAKERNLWHGYWEDKGLSRNQVLYEKKVEDNSTHAEFSDLISSRNIQVAGLIINFVDEQMHGMKAGMSGLNAVVTDWLQTWHFTDKIRILLDAGFEIIITADHGNQEAIGCGRLNEGVKAETKGERVRLYKSEEASNSSAALLDHKVLKWPGKKYGLPENIFPLVSCGTHAFVKVGKTIVAHGGISLHEVVVPFAVIKKKD